MPIFVAILFASFFITSCGSGNSNSTKENVENVASPVDTSSSQNEAAVNEEPGEPTSNCDEFLTGYENYVDNYIAVLKKYKANPTDATILKDYTKLAGESTEWSTKSAECAGDPKYSAKLTKIMTKLSTAMSSM